MIKKEQTDKTKSIDKSLEDSSKAIDSLKAKMAKKASRVPKQTLLVEDRLSAIQEDLPSMSDKMLAYQLRRIADSKMLESVSSLAKDSHSAKPSKLAARPKVPLPAAAANKANPEYKSSTFQCKSDLDSCLLGAQNALDKALCYALFIRCAIKG